VGFSHIGEMEENSAHDYIETIIGEVDRLESIVRDLQKYKDLEKTKTEISRLVTKLREELAVIRLKRIVPGRCKYCPL
jgi:hypothetical protein